MGEDTKVYVLSEIINLVGKISKKNCTFSKINKIEGTPILKLAMVKRKKNCGKKLKFVGKIRRENSS